MRDSTHPYDDRVVIRSVRSAGAGSGPRRPGRPRPRPASASPSAGAPSARVLSWPSRPLAGALARRDDPLGGARARATTRPIRASRLGSLVMSSTCVGPMTTPSTAPPLISGFLSFLTWRGDLLGQLGDAVAAPDGHDRALQELRQAVHAHLGEDPAGQRVLQRPDLDRLLAQVAPELVLGDRVQPLEVEDQDRPAPVEVGLELVHHHFFDVLAHDCVRCLRRRRRCGGRSGHDPDARAHGGRDGDRPDVRPLGGGRLDRPQVVQERRDVLEQLRPR